MLVHNLANNSVCMFDDNASLLYSVCYCWAKENGRMEQWVKLVQAMANADQFKESGFPVIVGQLSIACGDWCAI